MEVLATIISILGASFLLLFFSSQLEEKHGLLKLLTLFFVLSLLVLVPSALLNSETVCEQLVNSTVVVGNTSSFTYGTFCYEDSNSTNTVFLKGVMWYFGFFVLYVIIYLGYVALNFLKDSFQSRGRR